MRDARAWCSSGATASEWLQVSLGKEYTLTHVALQGIGGGYDVTALSVKYEKTQEGENWITYSKLVDGSETAKVILPCCVCFCPSFVSCLFVLLFLLLFLLSSLLFSPLHISLLLSSLLSSSLLSSSLLFSSLLFSSLLFSSVSFFPFHLQSVFFYLFFSFTFLFLMFRYNSAQHRPYWTGVCQV